MMSESPPVDPTASKWSDDAFLDRLRASTDDEANATVAELKMHEGEVDRVNRILVGLRTGSDALPDDAPPAFLDFLARFKERADACNTDPEQVRRGAEVFHRWAYPAAVVMLASSLPSGYSAPPLARVLTVSDDLAVHPYRRLMAVVQLLINVSSPEDGKTTDAEMSAMKLRLLHAGVRSLVPKSRPRYLERFGLPVNHEDMLATIMGFSLLVVDGIRTLGFEFSDQDADDYYAMWHHFSRLMNIAPSDDPLSEEFIPRDLEQAGIFYRSYQRRWFCQDPAQNADGVHLSERNRQMMVELVPAPLRFLGLGRAPDILMYELLGADGMERVGLQPLAGHRFDRWLLHLLLRVGQDVETVGEEFSSLFSAFILQGMVRRSMGRVTFSVPDSIEALKNLAEPQRFEEKS
ncbi:MAG: oxygenase MpaB family protein [Acidobacteriota bacterium]